MKNVGLASLIASLVTLTVVGIGVSASPPQGTGHGGAVASLLADTGGWLLLIPIFALPLWFGTYVFLNILRLLSITTKWKAIYVHAFIVATVIGIGASELLNEPWNSANSAELLRRTLLLTTFVTAYGVFSAAISELLDGNRPLLALPSSVLFMALPIIIPSAPWDRGESWTEHAEEVCRGNGVLRTKGFIETEGVLHQSADFSTAEDMLLEKRFLFFETGVNDPNTGWVPRKIQDLSPGDGSKYLRFFIAPKGSPTCTAHDQHVGNYEHNQIALRKKGLAADECIGTEKSDIAKARYELTYERELTEPYPSSSLLKERFAVRDRSDSSIHSEVTTVRFSSGGRSRDVRCDNRSEVEKLRTIVRSSAILTRPQRETFVDEQPKAFPQVTSSQGNLIKHTSPQSVHSDYPWQARRSVESGTISVDGDGSNMYLQIATPVRLFRSRVHTGASLFFGPMTMSSDQIGIYFASRNQANAGSSADFSIFQYTRDGVPVSRTDVLLSDFSRTGKNIVFVSHLQATKSGYLFTLLDGTKNEKNGQVTLQREATYEVEVARPK